QTGTVLFDWTDLVGNINSNSYTSNWQIAQTLFDLLQEGTNYISVRVYDTAGNVSVSTDVFYIRKDITSPVIYDNQSGDYLWRSENTGLYNVDFYDATSLINRFEIKITTGLEQTGALILDWTPIMTAINQNIYTDDWKIPDSVFNILPVGVNYISVRTYDNAGNIKVSTDVFYIQKDTMPVSIINNETPSHYAVWLNTNSLIYDIDVIGSGVSLIDRLEVAISTYGYNIQPYLIDWTTAVASINLNSYTTDWKIPDTLFDSMISFTTNYVSVRAYNQAGNKTTLSDAFYVLKDTINPVYQKNISDEYSWSNSSSTLYDIDFIDNQSGVYGFDVLASTNSSGIDPLITWSNVFSDINEKNFAQNWPLPESVFESLVENTTNYISVKVYDVAKNTSTLYDLFKVFKDTTPPSIYDNETGDIQWRGFESGYYNVDFNDTGGSLLKNIMIRVSTTPSGGPYYINWSVVVDSISESSYTTDWQIPLNIWSLINEGTNYAYVGAYDNAGNFKSQTVYAFMVKKDTTAPEIPILIYPSNNSKINNLSIGFVWSEASDILSGASYYQIIVSTYENFDFIYISTFSFTESKNLNLPEENKWYWKVKSYDNAGNYSSYSSTFSVIVDTTEPNITDNQSGDNIWRKENNGFYDVDFYDFGGSLLNKFQIKATTGPNQTGTVLFDWTDLVGNINSNSYASNWQIDQTLFDLLQEGTNYISLKVFDNSGNIKISTDTFYILKDTSSPSVMDNQSGDDNWYSSNPGSIFDIDFNDFSSMLSSASYYAYSDIHKTGIIVSSGVIFGPNYNQTIFTDNWGVDFSKLKEGYNYITIAAVDVSGNTTEYVDAFYIKKDTTSPIVEDLQTGDTNWYNINPGEIFNVRFYDYGIGISTVAIKVTTGPNQTGEVLINGSTIYSATPINSITDKWGLSDYNWSLLKQGTNYLSVYIYDGLNQITVSTDVFYIQKDTTPPSQITNLNAYNNLVALDEGSLYLSWTAGGDDGNIGAVKSYDIRYATYNIDSSNFDLASVYVSTIVPKYYGLTELLKIENLNPGTTYYFALKSLDKAGNKSLISNTSSTYAVPDLTPPYSVSDLNGVPGDFTGQIKLSWTARGEGTNGVEGNQAVSGYIIKYATYPINSSNFDSALTYFNSIIPKYHGETEEVVIEGLNPETTYYIALKSFDEINNISDISNTTFTYAAPKGARDAVILYSKSGSSTLKYRKYSNAQWSSELDTGVSFSGTVRWIILRSIPVVKDEMVAGVLDSNNVLKIIKYDGVLDVWSDITPTPNPSPGNSLYRNFDLAVEQNSARVMFAYYNGTDGSINYAVYSSTGNSWVIPPTQLAMASLTGQIYWVKLKSDFNSNRIAVTVLDSNSGISANIWNGSAWIDARNLTTAASASAYEVFDIAWESQTGDLLALWGTGTTTNFNKWYSTGTWGGNRTGPALGVTPYWVRLCSSPNSNKIGFTSIYGATRWNVSIWRPNGTEGWSALPTADTAMSANDKRITDCAWQSKTEQFISVAVDNLGTYDTQFDWITWNNGTWSPASPSVTTANTNTTFSSDIKWTSLLPDPDTDNVMALAVDTSKNLRSTVWSGSLWAASGVGSNFYHAVVQDYNYESFAIEFKRKDNIPPTIINNQTGDNIWRNSNYQNYSV
ncbi:MAG TPA: hypothetical protein PK103_08660, partial [Elusimicrobiales bacterium]|nr:hypothetical protein [Elusimicrobiales bacterium]